MNSEEENRNECNDVIAQRQYDIKVNVSYDELCSEDNISNNNEKLSDKVKVIDGNEYIDVNNGSENAEERNLGKGISLN